MTDVTSDKQAIYTLRELVAALVAAEAEAATLRAVADAARVVSEVEKTGTLPDFQPLADALAALDAGGERA